MKIIIERKNKVKKKNCFKDKKTLDRNLVVLRTEAMNQYVKCLEFRPLNPCKSQSVCQKEGDRRIPGLPWPACQN